MNIQGIFNTAVSLAKDNPVIAGIVLLLLVIYIYRRPKVFFKIVLISLILGATIYLIISLATPGALQKGKAIHRDERSGALR